MNGPVLVIDDGSAVVFELRSVLGRLRIENERALSGPHALLLADRLRPSLVLTDVFVPGTNGVALSRALEARGIETVILSSTAPAFSSSGAPNAAVILRDDPWRAPLLKHLLPKAGVLSERTKAELAAWSRGEPLGSNGHGPAEEGDFRPAPPARSEGAADLASILTRIDALEDCTAITHLLLAELEGTTEVEARLAPLRRHPRSQVRQAAFQASAALCRAEDAAELVAAADESKALLFVLIGASTRGPEGLPFLEHIALRTSAPATLRVKALAVHTRRSTTSGSSTWLATLVADPSTEVVHAALRALASKGVDMLVPLLSRVDLGPETRAAALLVLGLRAPRSSFDEGMAIALEDPSDLVRAAAYELGFKRLGGRCASLLERLVAEASEGAGFAALAGVLDLDEAGFGVLEAMEASPLLPAVRREVARALFERFGRGEAPSEDHEHLVEDLKEELVETRPEAPADFVGDERLDHDFYSGPTEPRRPAVSEPAPPRPKTPPPRPRSIKSKARAPAAEPGPSPRELRARLDAAEAQGQAGFAVVVEIAREKRAPVDLRTRAIRLLGTSLAGPEAFVVLDALLLDEAASVQNVALGVFMVAKKQHHERFIEVATRVETSAKVRARAVRHLGARYAREEITEPLERLLFDGSTLVRRAALEALFPTLRGLDGDGLEEGLLNLMGHHASDRVRVSAAHAIGAFGSERSLSAIDSLLTSLFQASEVGQAARLAVVRLRKRLAAE